MDYWESVLQEVLHKGDENYHFRFTDIGRSLVKERTRKQRQQRPFADNGAVSMFFLGDSFPGVYLTKREAQSMYYLLQNKTIPQVGKLLALSARTIEFYVKNMKLKVGAKTKRHLLDVIRSTDIMNQLEEIAALDY